jgi:SAM-dependent methyltransferase
MEQRMRGRRLILRGLFRLLYGPGAHVYDRFTDLLFAGEWRRWQMAALEAMPRGGTVVELGAGTGALAALVADRFDTWIGVECSGWMIAVARKRHRPPRPTIVRADVSALPLAASCADVVVATFPTAYILDPNVLREARRVVKPTGRLIVVLTGELVPKGIRRRIVGAVMTLANGQGRPADDQPIELRGFDGDWSWRDTEFGKAFVFVGSPVASWDADCSRPRDDAGERGKVRRSDRRHRSR